MVYGAVELHVVEFMSDVGKSHYIRTVNLVSAGTDL